MAKLRKIPTRREIRTVLMLPDEFRETKARVMRHRGRSLKRWKGLPKPKSKVPFHPLDVVTNGIMGKLGAEVAPRVKELERERVRAVREEMLEYLRKEGLAK